MKFNPDLHKRKSLRLKNYDYSKNGLYFITIVVQNKLCLFGEIKNNELNLFESGKIISHNWLDLGNKYENIFLHEFVVMPNHFHGIIEIVEDENNVNNIVGVNLVFAQKTNNDNIRVNTRFTPTGGKFEYNKNSISSIIQGFKSKTTNEYIKNVKNNNWLSFNKKLWQRNYYEHIIRNQESYIKISEYIQNNPKKWDEDKFYFSEF